MEDYFLESEYMYITEEEVERVKEDLHKLYLWRPKPKVWKK